MVDPVMDLKLDPSGRQNIERPRRNERLPLEQGLADGDRVGRVEQVGPVIGLHVAAERHSDRTHIGHRHIVAAAVEAARGAALLVGCRRYGARARWRFRRIRVNQIVAPQDETEHVEIEQAPTKRQLMPFDESIDSPEKYSGDGAQDTVADERVGMPAHSQPVPGAGGDTLSCHSTAVSSIGVTFSSTKRWMHKSKAMSPRASRSAASLARYSGSLSAGSGAGAADATGRMRKRTASSPHFIAPLLQ